MYKLELSKEELHCIIMANMDYAEKLCTQHNDKPFDAQKRYELVVNLETKLQGVWNKGDKIDAK
tara:strand:- start:315 stop:506 length:192 start_codon:yes stop_codon:yes gene_type:complete